MRQAAQSSNRQHRAAGASEVRDEYRKQALTGERADLAETLTKHRNFLRFTTSDMTDEQAAQRTTVSELCLGGIIKHVTAVERQWARFIVEGPSADGQLG